jgi:hypothetical protein
MPPEPILVVLGLTSSEAQDLALLCERLTTDALHFLATSIPQQIITVPRWKIVVKRLADQLTEAGYPPVHEMGGNDSD